MRRRHFAPEASFCRASRPGGNLRFGIRRNFITRSMLLYTLAALISLLLSAVSITGISRYFAELYITEASRSAKERISLELAEAVNRSLAIAQSPAMVKFLQYDSQPSIISRINSELSSVMSPITGADYFAVSEKSGRYYLNGQYKYTVNRAAPGDAWYQGLKNLNGLYSLNYERNYSHGLARLWINVPVRYLGSFIGAAGFGIDWQKKSEQWNLELPGKNRLFLLQENGDILSAPALYKQYSNINALFPVERRGLMSNLASGGSRPEITSNTFIILDRDSVIRSFSFARIPDTPWIMLLVSDFGPLLRLEYILPAGIIILAGLALLLLLQVFLVNRVILDPLYQVIQAVKSYAKGNLGQRLKLPVKNEFSILADNLNHMAESMQENVERLERRENEIQGYSNELERLVSRRTTELKRTFESIKQDLKIARSIQQNDLRRLHSRYGALHFHWKYYPLDEVGGDIFDICELSPGRVRVFLADATGHGVQAALVTMVIREVYEDLKRIVLDPSELMNVLNHNFHERFLELSLFFTCVVIDIDTDTCILRYSMAGHPSPFLIQNSDVEILHTPGMAMGVNPDTEYTSKTVNFTPGSRLVLFTDGLVEQISTEERELGDEDLAGIIRANAHRSLRGMVQHALAAVYRFAGVNRVFDDITIIGIEFENQASR